MLNRTTLFRGEDGFSLMVSTYVQAMGKDYLLATLKPLIQMVISSYSQGRSFEVNAS